MGTVQQRLDTPAAWLHLRKKICNWAGRNQTESSSGLFVRLPSGGSFNEPRGVVVLSKSLPGTLLLYRARGPNPHLCFRRASMVLPEPWFPM